MVKGVATSIITLAVLMGVLVACGGTTQVVAPTPQVNRSIPTPITELSSTPLPSPTLGVSEPETETVNISDLDDTVPTITGPSGGAGAGSSSKSINENATAVHTFSADETVTWSLNGGADASKFNINSSTGALTFKSAPDFENPSDIGTNNSYEVKVRATDST